MSEKGDSRQSSASVADLVEEGRTKTKQKAGLPLGKETSNGNIYDFDEHVEVSYQEVFKEPTSVQSWSRVEDTYRDIFTYTQDFTYRVLVLLLGWLLGVIWGLLIGILDFFMVWLLQPTIKMFFILLRAAFNVWTTIIRGLCDPFFESCGQMLSYIRAILHLNTDLSLPSPTLPTPNPGPGVREV